MTYLRPHSRRFGRGARIAAGILVGLFLIVALIQWRSPYFFPGLATAVAAPYWQTVFSIETGALKSPASLLAENESLSRELAGLQIAMSSSSVAVLASENADLRALLGRASTTPTMTLAAVLIRPPFAPYDEIVIDLGTDDGVSSTTLVYASGGVPVGRVSEALAATSKVALFTSPGQSYSVVIGASDFSASAVGHGGGQYQAKVPHGSAVSVGDAVIATALSSRPFGTVISVITDPSNPFDTVIIVPPVDPYSLRWVLLNLNLGQKRSK